MMARFGKAAKWSKAPAKGAGLATMFPIWREPTEDEVIEALTSAGEDPNPIVFAIWKRNGPIFVWCPKYGLLTYRIEDDCLYIACQEYLAGRGQVYETEAELDDYARRHGWVNWSLAQGARVV